MKEVAKELDGLEELVARGEEAEAVTRLASLGSIHTRGSRAYQKSILALLVRISRGQSEVGPGTKFTESLLKEVRREYIQERLVRYFADFHDYSQTFTECMIQRNGTVRQQLFSPDRILSKEDYCYTFARAAGLQVPERYQSGVRKDELEPRDQCVIKPVGLAGSRGVHVIERIAGSGYRDVTLDRTFSDWPQLVESLETEIDGGAKKWSGFWLSEELIRSPVEDEASARDLKIYSFYGQLGVALEISRWGSQKQYSWYDGDLQKVDVGKYSQSPSVEPSVLSSLDLDLKKAARIGAKIPAPFCRLDFLIGPKGLVLGELSFRPGQFHQFSREYDREFGKKFKAAEGRLADDLLQGVTFPEFEIARRSFVDDLGN